MKVSSAVDFAGLGRTHLSNAEGMVCVEDAPPVAGGGPEKSGPIQSVRCLCI
jgi:hypothetical protein